MRKRPSGLILCFAVLTALPAETAWGREVVQTFPHRATAGPSPTEQHARQQALQDWLLEELPPGVLDRPVLIPVSAEEMAGVDRQDRENPGISVVGLVKKVGLRVDLSEFGRDTPPGQPARGVVRSTADGGLVWALALASPDASALRVEFRDVRLPDSAGLYVHNGLGQAFGPYARRTGDAGGTFWSHTVPGPTVFIELYLPHPGELAAMTRPGFTIASAGHLGPRFQPAAVAATESFCGFNAACVENAECYDSSTWSFLDDAQDGVALMLWVSGAFINACSGGLLADTDPTTEIPYFLTANHCISKNNNAANLETYFRFRVPCGAGCPAQWAGGGIQLLGATIRATSRTGDFTLLQLLETPPAGSTYLGWTTAAVANADGTSLFRVSHPSTAPQAFSAHVVDTSAPTCLNAPRGDWIYSRDVTGATEGGSSGSVVCNAAGQVVGQLTGSCGTNSDECDAVNNATLDGAFAGYFDSVASFLDPPVTCTPEPEICDGLDNDCDGQIDNGFPPPAGPLALTVDLQELSWNADSPATGYDVVRGDLLTLSMGAGDFSTSTTECLADDLPATSIADPTLPPAGGIWWTLVRSVDCTTPGTYGNLGRDEGIQASANGCP